MDGERDSISELRETLRRRPAPWELERSARPRRGVGARSALSLVRLPNLRRLVPRPHVRPHLVGASRRGTSALRLMLRAARSFAVALAMALGVAARWAARAAIRALAVGARALGAAGLRLWSFTARSAAAAARSAAAAARSAAARARPRRRRRASPGVEARSTPTTAEERERQIEEQERRRLEQRVLTLGAEHPDVAVLLQIVAERCAARGEADEAIALYERALRIQEMAFGPDSPALRPLLGDLAELERELGRDEDAAVYEARRRTIGQHSAIEDLSKADGVSKANGVPHPV